ncbi:MAG: DUF4436 family protein, partial [Acidimicrobiales bacterium]
GADGATVSVEVMEIVSGERRLDLLLRPIPHEGVANSTGAEFAQDMSVTVRGTGRPPVVFDFGKDQIIDSVTVPVTIDKGASRFPFDDPSGNLRVQMMAEDGSTTPIDVRLVNSTDEWRLSAAVERDRDGFLAVEVSARRDVLASALAIFTLLAIATIAVVTVAVVGGALVKGRVEFSQVVWMGAMLIAIPTMRRSMPGAPPIGTTADTYLVFPAVVVVALALIAGTLVLATTEGLAGKKKPT